MSRGPSVQERPCSLLSFPKGELNRPLALSSGWSDDSSVPILITGPQVLPGVLLVANKGLGLQPELSRTEIWDTGEEKPAQDKEPVAQGHLHGATRVVTQGPAFERALCVPNALLSHPDTLSAFEPDAHVFVLQGAPQIPKPGLLHPLSSSLKSALSWLFTSLTTKKPHDGTSQVPDASVAPAAGQALVSALTPWAAVPHRPLS